MRKLVLSVCLSVLVLPHHAPAQPKGPCRLWYVEVNGKHGYIDNSGNTIIDPKFDYGFDFYDGLAAIETSKKWGYVDCTGRLIIPPQFTNAYYF
jgi:hypothetical protein